MSEGEKKGNEEYAETIANRGSTLTLALSQREREGVRETSTNRSHDTRP